MQDIKKLELSITFVDCIGFYLKSKFKSAVVDFGHLFSIGCIINHFKELYATCK